jgi:fructose-bisphosphate aldolase class 1
VKVDCGTTPLFTSSPFPELITQGLDDLGPRLVRIFDAGALFAKWRAVFTLDVHRGLPSQECIDANCRALAQYAAICQLKGIVPILEPEILMEGNFTFEESGKCTERVLGKLYECCRDAGVVLEATLLKPSMVCEGTETRKQRHHDVESPAPQDTGDRERSSYANAVALHTLSALMHAVPIAVPGVMFLSGGQSEDEAVDNLDAISFLGALGIVSTETCAPSSFPSLSLTTVPSASSSDALMTLPMPDDEAAMEEKAELIAWGGLARRTRNVMKAPWTLSFSFGRALQTSVLRVWNGSDDNREEAQRVLQERVRAASLASKGLREEARRTTAAFSAKKTVHGDAGGGPYGLMSDGL